MFKKYCLICGVEIKKETAIKRFGKHFCNEQHAQQYVEKRQIEESRSSEEGRRSRGFSC